MRKILFKGKRKDNGEWVEGFYFKKDEHNHYIGDGQVPAQFFYEVIPETVRQFTGLTDKNGKEIFEGDIFKFPDEIWESSYTSCGTEYNSFTVENYGVVGFREDTGRFDFIKYKFDENSVEADLHENHDIEFCEFVSDLEIVGNIHDNPELLSEVQK
ncbi:MAG: YopX family protein [Ruminococcus sp.]|nr:YopX family protein [Ruminococcus sp.]